MLNRRLFMGGLLAAFAAPAIIRIPGLLMPVKPVVIRPFEMHTIIEIVDALGAKRSIRMDGAESIMMPGRLPQLSILDNEVVLAVRYVVAPDVPLDEFQDIAASRAAARWNEWREFYESGRPGALPLVTTA